MISTICILCALFSLFLLIGAATTMEKEPITGCLGIILHALNFAGLIAILIMVN